jgi:hypothetical protein
MVKALPSLSQGRQWLGHALPTPSLRVCQSLAKGGPSLLAGLPTPSLRQRLPGEGVPTTLPKPSPPPTAALLTPSPRFPFPNHAL